LSIPTDNSSPEAFAALVADNAELRSRLEEATETLNAIRDGEVDAVVVGGPDGRQIYTLESADRHYRMLIEQMGDGAIMLSPEGAVLYANKALSEMLDAPIANLVGARFGPYINADSVAGFARLLAHGGRTQLRLKRDRELTPFTVQISLVELEAGGQTLLCGVITDLTQTLAAVRDVAEARAKLAIEAARHESDERYRLILESTTDYAIMAIDLLGRVTIWNSGAQRMLGWSVDEAVGKPMPGLLPTEDEGAADSESALLRKHGRAELERWQARKDGSQFWVNALTMPLLGSDGDVIGFLRILQDRTERRQADLNQHTLINELNHRVKNTLSTVQSIVTLTLRDAASALHAREALEDRLMALSRAHDVLTRESWEGAELSEIVAQAVAPYQTSDAPRIRIDGEPVRLSPRLALAIAMALQELTTNAVKYGALSDVDGKLDITWTIVGLDLRLVWRERDGPPVTPPKRRGFGSRLIERSLAADFKGGSEIEFAPTGVVCVINAQVDR
jgi:PAS domain S-box-containing protein